MRYLEHRFAVWYNHTRPVRRRGAVWAGRFHNTIVEGGEALGKCVAYVERNAVQAQIVRRAEDYRFCSLSARVRGENSLCGPDAERLLLAAIGEWLGVHDVETLWRRLVEVVAASAPGDGRYWTYGRIVGSEAFVAAVLQHAGWKDRKVLLGPGLFAACRCRTDDS